MQFLKSYLCPFILLIVVNQPVNAAGVINTFSKSVQNGDAVFDINSRPVADSSVHIVTVSLKRGGKKVATLKADVDQLPYSAEAVDLAKDGTTELVLISRAKDGVASELLDVCWLDGTNFLHRTTIPEPDEKTGYKGGDRFYIEDHLVVRSFPVYLDSDLPGKPSGGTRLLKYKFKDGVFTLYVESERADTISDDSMLKSAIQPSHKEIRPKNAPLLVPAGLVITEVATVETGIEIKTNGTVPKFRTIRLDKPERIAIDITGADSLLAGRKISINSFGITKARVGRNKGFLRVVLDTEQKIFPKFEVRSSGTGLIVEFSK